MLVVSKLYGSVYFVPVTGPLQGSHHGKVADPNDRNFKIDKKWIQTEQNGTLSSRILNIQDGTITRSTPDRLWTLAGGSLLSRRKSQKAKNTSKNT